MAKSVLHSDTIMWGCYQALHKDLSQHVDEPLHATLLDYRQHKYLIPMYARPYNVKCRVQLSTWLKRYRFSHDVYSDADLEKRTNEKFVADQLRIGMHMDLPYRSYLVIQRARRIIKGVLGDYKDEEIFRHCSFSKNSTVGFGGEDVYLDKKIFPGTRLTGTQDEVRWFTSYLRSDRQLRRSLQSETRLNNGVIRRRVDYNIVASLRQVNVPKTAEILRSVRPNTLIGSFRSIGIGTLVRERIKERLGINLNYLQEKHKHLACIASRSLSLVTADLSSASDSFTPALLNRLLPRSWYTALKLGRTPYVEVGDQVLWSPSFMAMGIGYTFPVMTLCFFAILRAIQQLSRTGGLVSVFGDDLIYPSKIHHYVVGVFNDLNFRLNMDKTFTLVPFRESCGGDYYDKVDVRPARPEGVSVMLEGLSIAAYVYKLFNSLIRRWCEEEIPCTLSYLRSILVRNGFPLFSVPTHFPDDSGLKDGNWLKVARAERDNGNRRKPFYNGLLVDCIASADRLKPVGYQGIYLWESIRSGPYGDAHDSHFDPYRSVTARLVWRLSNKPKEYVLSQGMKRYRKLVAFQTKRGTRYFQPKTVNV